MRDGDVLLSLMLQYNAFIFNDLPCSVFADPEFKTLFLSTLQP